MQRGQGITAGNSTLVQVRFQWLIEHSTRINICAWLTVYRFDFPTCTNLRNVSSKANETTNRQHHTI